MSASLSNAAKSRGKYEEEKSTFRFILYMMRKAGRLGTPRPDCDTASRILACMVEVARPIRVVGQSASAAPLVIYLVRAECPGSLVSVAVPDEDTTLSIPSYQKNPTISILSVFPAIGTTHRVCTMPPSSLASQVDTTLVSKLLADVNQLVKDSNSGNARAREAAVSSCLALASALETPNEAIVRMTWTEVSHALDARRRTNAKVYCSPVILQSYVSPLTSISLKVSQQKVALRSLALNLGEYAQQTLA